MPSEDRTQKNAQMALIGRIGAHVSHSRHDSRELTANARAAFQSKFEAEVDPDSILEPEERARRADQARRAYYADLAYKSAIARQKRASPRRARPASDQGSR